MAHNAIFHLNLARKQKSPETTGIHDTRRNTVLVIGAYILKIDFKLSLSVSIIICRMVYLNCKCIIKQMSRKTDATPRLVLLEENKINSSNCKDKQLLSHSTNLQYLLVLGMRLNGCFSSGHFCLQEINFSFQSCQLLVQRGQSRTAAHVKGVEEVGDSFDGTGNLEREIIKKMTSHCVILDLKC